MNRNILICSLLIAGFFMVLSFILRLLFFTTYTSLVQQPVIIFITWFGVMVLIFYFLKNDFPEIYKQLILFKEKTSETHPITENDNLDLLDVDDNDYSDVFNHQNASEASSATSPFNEKEAKTMNKVMNYDDEPIVPNSETSAYYKDVFTKEDPKKLAGLIKNYLDKD